MNFKNLNYKWLLTLAVMFTIVLFSCNKEKRYSKKLIKGEVWKVKDITVAGNSLNTYGEWLVTQDIDIYDSVPQVMWQNDAGSTIFNWQFQNKGDNFQLNYAHQCVECDSTTLSALDYLCYDISGSYTVERHKSKEMKFTSTSTNAYAGQNVVIEIEK